MSDSGTSEEKSLPPSDKKLKDLRKKGQISRSNDMVVALTTVGSVLYLWVSFSSFIKSYQTAVNELILQRDRDFFDAASKGVSIFSSRLGGYLIVLILIVIVLVIIGNIIINKGFLFSFDPIKFDISKLNPIEGFKRMISLRSLIDIVKNTIKTILFVSISIFVLWSSFSAPFHIPYCGLSCFTSIMSMLVAPILIAGAAILLLSGVIDIGVQQWLFRRQQRMTKTEAKREQKDQDGSPEVKMSQKRSRQRLLQRNSEYSVEDATLFIAGASAIVGLRFVQGETPLPIVVCKGKGNQVDIILDYAYSNRRSIYFDDDNSIALSSKIEIGNPITEVFFEAFISAYKAAEKPS